MNKTQTIILCGGVVALGIVAAVANKPGQEPQPTATVTATATATVTAEAKAEIPQVCLDALAAADIRNEVSLDFIRIIQQHMQDEADVWGSLSDGDTAALVDYTRKSKTMQGDIEALSDRLTDGPDYVSLRAQCKAAG